MTLNITTLGIMMLSIMTPLRMALNIKTLGIIIFNITIGIY